MTTINVYYAVDTDDGTVAALFPDDKRMTGNSFDPADWRITCYAHIGQHSEATQGYVANHTRPATKAEYADLHAEISAIYSPDAIDLAVINEARFHFSEGCSVVYRPDDDSEADTAYTSYPFPQFDDSDEFAEDFANGGISIHEVTASVPDARDYLRGFGVWNDDELADHSENLARLLWVAEGYMKDRGEWMMSE